MKNILIPVTFEADTLQAMMIAADMQRYAGGSINLLTISEITDSITDLLFLDVNDSVDRQKRGEVMMLWENMKADHEIKADVLEHHRYGLSRPLMKQLLGRLDIDLVIVPVSFQKSREHIHRQTLKLLQESNCPLMMLPSKSLVYKGILRALYLDQTDKAVTPAVQQFPFHVIHQSMISNGEYDSIQSVIDKMQIDLIVKGKPKKNSVDRHAIDTSALGLPVLTI